MIIYQELKIYLRQIKIKDTLTKTLKHLIFFFIDLNLSEILQNFEFYLFN